MKASMRFLKNEIPIGKIIRSLALRENNYIRLWQKNIGMKKIETVGIVGAGTMGAALAQKFAQQGFKVVLCDREDRFLEKGVGGIRQTLEQGIERGMFSTEQVEAILGKIKSTTEAKDLAVCDLVIEAIFENLEAKTSLFKDLGTILPKETILATNTSSFSVNELAQSYPFPENFIGLHYFFHAAKNRLVEIIPGEKTSQDVLKSMELFSFLSGKDPILCKDSNGFVVNRFFVPWLNESTRLLEEGVGSIPVIDRVCRDIFGIGMGPFALMNATGVPVAYHSQKTLEVFGAGYEACEKLREQTELNLPWNIEGSDESTTEIEKTIRERMMGIVFFVCLQLLEEKVCSPSEIDRGARIGLRWKRGPVTMMRKEGSEQVKKLVSAIAHQYGAKIPTGISAENWTPEYVNLSFNGKVAVLKFTRPEDLNALNEEVVKELDAKFQLAQNNPIVETIVLTGSGKAFVAGADIGFFLKNMKAQNIGKIKSFTEFGQRVFDKIDHSPKKVIALINGLAFGGGLELALCADVILAVPQAIMAFPETGIGIYPGLGGTQRTPKRVGKGLAKFLVMTGQILPAKSAAEIGLIDALINPEELLEIEMGTHLMPESFPEPAIRGSKWEMFEKLFNQNSLAQLMSGAQAATEFPGVEKVLEKLGKKAPIPLKISEKLINDLKGPASELEEIEHVFSTEDAFLGLSSMGNKVTYSGK